MRGDCGVAGEGRVVDVPKFHSWGKCTVTLNKYQLRLDVQRFLWPAYCIYVGPSSCISGVIIIYMDPLSCILGCNDYPAEINHLLSCLYHINPTTPLLPDTLLYATQDCSLKMILLITDLLSGEYYLQPSSLDQHCCLVQSTLPVYHSVQGLQYHSVLM